MINRVTKYFWNQKDAIQRKYMCKACQRRFPNRSNMRWFALFQVWKMPKSGGLAMRSNTMRWSRRSYGRHWRRKKLPSSSPPVRSTGHQAMKKLLLKALWQGLTRLEKYKAKVRRVGQERRDGSWRS